MPVNPPQVLAETSTTLARTPLTGKFHRICGAFREQWRRFGYRTELPDPCPVMYSESSEDLHTYSTIRPLAFQKSGYVW